MGARRRRPSREATYPNDQGGVAASFLRASRIRLRGIHDRVQPFHLFWRVRLPAWALTATPIGLLVSPWLAPLGPLGFELAMLAIGYRAMRRVRAQRSGPSGDWPGDDAGVREPRRPGPLAGAGAIALPEPNRPQG